MRFAIAFSIFCLLQSPVCQSEPVLIELPGYAKAIVGGYGKKRVTISENRNEKFYSLKNLMQVTLELPCMNHDAHFIHSGLYTMLLPLLKKPVFL